MITPPKNTLNGFNRLAGLVADEVTRLTSRFEHPHSAYGSPRTRLTTSAVAKRFGVRRCCAAFQHFRQQSQRDCVLQPRVARHELPWDTIARFPNPERVVALPPFKGYPSAIIQAPSERHTTEPAASNTSEFPHLPQPQFAICIFHFAFLPIAGRRPIPTLSRGQRPRTNTGLSPKIPPPPLPAFVIGLLSVSAPLR